MLVANVTAGPLLLAILTLNEVKGKNLSLRVNSAWQFQCLPTEIAMSLMLLAMTGEKKNRNSRSCSEHQRGISLLK